MRRSAGVDVDGVDGLGLGEHRDGAGGGVDPPLRFGLGDALDPVGAGLELEPGEDAAAADPDDHLLVAAHLAGALAVDLGAPAARLGIAQVHAQQVPGEQGGLGPAGAGADLEKAVALVVGVRRDQQPMQFGFQGVAAVGGGGQFVAGQVRHLRVGEQLLRRRHLGLGPPIAREALHQGFELRVLAAQVPEPVGVGLGLGVRQQQGDLAEALVHALQPVADRSIHADCHRCQDAAGRARAGSSANSSLAASRISASPSRAAWRSRVLGACSSLLVRVWARKVSTSAAGLPASSWRLARSSTSSRKTSAPLAVVLDHIGGVERAHPRHELVGVEGDDLLGLQRRRLARAQALVDHPLEVVDGVEIDVAQGADLRLDVPRDGDVHHEHGPVLALLERPLHRALAQHRQRAGGGGDDDVRLRQVVGDLGQRDGEAVELGGHLVGALHGAIGDDDAPDAVLMEVTGGQFDGLPGADQHGRLFGQVAEDLAGQADRREGHRHRAAADGGVRAHRLGHREGVLEQASEQFAGGGAVGRGLEGALDLTQDLGARPGPWSPGRRRPAAGGSPRRGRRGRRGTG